MIDYKSAHCLNLNELKFLRKKLKSKDSLLLIYFQLLAYNNEISEKIMELSKFLPRSKMIKDDIGNIQNGVITYIIQYIIFLLICFQSDLRSLLFAKSSYQFYYCLQIVLKLILKKKKNTDFLSRFISNNGFELLQNQFNTFDFKNPTIRIQIKLFGIIGQIHSVIILK